MSYNPTSSDNPIDEQSQPQTDDHSGTEAQLLDGRYAVKRAPPY